MSVIGLIVVQQESRLLELRQESRVIELVAESRLLELESYPMTLLASKQHTVGDTRRWTVRYKKWLDNTVNIKTINVTSSSATCTIGTPAPAIVGSDVQFFLTGGVLDEVLTVSLSMTDSIGNIKNDSIQFMVVSP